MIASSTPSEEHLTLSIGQVYEIRTEGLRHYTISNKEIINAKHNKKQDSIMIKAKKQGRSAILYWDKQKKRKIYNVFVIQKKLQLKLHSIVDSLKKLGLEGAIRGNQIVVEGKIEDINQYQLINNLKNEHPQKILLYSNIDRKLRNEIIAKVYKDFFDDGIETITCRVELSKITCRYSEQEKPGKDLIEHFSKNYHIKFIPQKENSRNENFVLKLTFLQTYNRGNNKNQFGINALNLNWEQINNALKNTILNKVVIEANGISTYVKSLGHQEVIITQNSPVLLQIGGDIKIGRKSDSEGNKIETEWRFVGIKSNISLERISDRIFLKYKINSTGPSDEGMSYNKSIKSSSLYIALDKQIKLFSLSFDSQFKNSKKMSFLGDVPILGDFFKSIEKGSQNNQIVALIQLEKLGIN